MRHHTLRLGLVLVLLASVARAETPKRLPFDLAGVQGIDRYAGPAKGKDLLARNGMVITPETQRRLFQFYVGGMNFGSDVKDHSAEEFLKTLRSCSERALPVFVTTDTAIDALSNIIEDEFRERELPRTESLKPILRKIWAQLANGNLTRGSEGLFAKKETLALSEESKAHAATLVAVTMKLLEPNWKPSGELERKLWKAIEPEVNAELNRIEAGAVQASPLFGCAIDYGQCRPRSFYAANEKLARFYRARTFVGFPMDLRNDSVLRAGYIIGWGVGRELDEFIAPDRELIGDTNLPTLGEVVMNSLTGDIVEAARKDLLVRKDGFRYRRLLRESIDGKPRVFISASAADAAKDDAEPRLLAAILPKLASEDTILLQKCAFPAIPARTWPRGLDLMACLGDDRARTLTLAAESGALRPALAQAIDEARSVTVSHRPLQLFELWQMIWKTLREPKLTPRHPAFMSTAAYSDKCLNTALSGWAGYRHLVQLHAEEGGTLFCGDPKLPVGFVEPNLPFWDTMIRACLEVQKEFPFSKDGVARLNRLSLLCLGARQIAEAQLSGEELSDKQTEWFESFVRELADVCGYSGTPLSSADDRATVATVIAEASSGEVMHVGLGRPQAIYVIVDYGSNRVLARGGVLMYREFRQRGRLDDETWGQMLEQGKVPPPPEWMGGLLCQ